jgi:hypothetical protein
MSAKNDESRTGDAWDKVRKAGGSIIGPDGENLTADADGRGDFVATMKRTCTNVGKLHAALSDMETAAARAEEIASFNALPLTNPKCYSKPIVRLSAGCDVEWEMVKRAGTEERNCTEPR